MNEASQKFLSTHKMFKVYLSTEDDMEIIKMLMKTNNASKTIREALRIYLAQISASEPKTYTDLYAKYGDPGGTT